MCLKPACTIHVPCLCSCHLTQLRKRTNAFRDIGITIETSNSKAKTLFSELHTYDIQNNILAPGLIDPHMHIESSMMTACAYSEAALVVVVTKILYVSK